MGSRSTEIDDQFTVDSTPEDVAVLYSWANLQGAKYRDYSASRREYRAQVRYRAAKDLLERELAGQFEAETSVARAEKAADRSVVPRMRELTEQAAAAAVVVLHAVNIIWAALLPTAQSPARAAAASDC